MAIIVLVLYNMYQDNVPGKVLDFAFGDRVEHVIDKEHLNTNAKNT